MFFKSDYQRTGIDRLSNIRHQKYNHVEFIQIVKGKGNVLAGSHIMPMHNGAVFIIDSAQPHCTAPAAPDDYVRNCITVDRPSFDNFLNAASAAHIVDGLYKNGVCCVLPDKDTWVKIDGIFKRLDTLHKNNAPEADKFLFLLELILTLRDCSPASNTLSHDKSAVTRALRYIEYNFSNGITTAEIADALHISRYHLCHIFKKKTGLTLTEYLLDKRLAAADAMLADRSLSISDISARAGFSSESYFISKYKSRYGISPGKKRSADRVI